MIINPGHQWEATLEVSGLALPVIADLPEGGRLALKATPLSPFVPGPPLPPGVMLILLPAEVANKVRGQIVEAKKDPKLAAAMGSAPVWLQLHGLKIPLLVDLPVGGEVSLTRGLELTGKPVHVPPLEAGCMIALLMPDIAEQVRPIIKQAKAADAALEKKLLNGHGFEA